MENPNSPEARALRRMRCYLSSEEFNDYFCKLTNQSLLPEELKIFLKQTEEKIIEREKKYEEDLRKKVNLWLSQNKKMVEDIVSYEGLSDEVKRIVNRYKTGDYKPIESLNGIIDVFFDYLNTLPDENKKIEACDKIIEQSREMHDTLIRLKKYD